MLEKNKNEKVLIKKKYKICKFKKKLIIFTIINVCNLSLQHFLK